MGRISKTLSLILVAILAVSSIMLVNPVFASVLKLQVPEFTVAYADHSYDVSASTSIDPFTDETVENPAHHVENRIVTLTIKNQTVDRGQLHYVVQMKGHFLGNWTGIYDGVASEDSLLTVWAFTSSEQAGSGEGRLYFMGSSFYLPPDGQVDFRVKAQTWGEVMADRTAENPFGGSITTLFGESDWNGIQTITIPTDSVSTPTSPNPAASDLTPTSTPTAISTAPNANAATVPLSVFIAVVVVLAAVIASLGLLLYRRHRGSTKTFER